MTDTASLLPQFANQWVLREKPEASVEISKHFELKQNVPIFDKPASVEGKILIKITYFSVDPAQLTWINNRKSRLYVPPVELGDPVKCGSVAEVLESWTPEFPKGCLVYGYFTWADYMLADPALIAKNMAPIQIIPPGIDPTDYLALGLTAMTAYIGLIEVGEASSKDKTIVVSGAAGATGSNVCQIAKNILGVKKVIGICGTDEKCAFLKNTLHVDVALNYRSPNFAQEFVDATPDFIDLYFDNVGGEMVNLVCKRIKNGGRIIAVGGISSYSDASNPPALSMDGYLELIYQNARILGVIITNHLHLIPKVLGQLSEWVQSGKLVLIKDVRQVSFERVPEGLLMLLEGGNTGKLILELES